MRALTRPVDLLAAVLSPPRCAACDARVAWLRAFCPVCAATCLPLEGAAALRAPFAYGGAIATAISRLKYDRRPELAAPLGDLLDASLRELDVDVIVPVPLGSARLRERGYNQSALIAARVSRSRGVPLACDWLRRTRESAPQATLDAGARVHNVAGAFAADRAARGARVALVDDVVTTGSTLGEAARALEAAGADVRRALAVAAAVLDVGAARGSSLPRRHATGSVTRDDRPLAARRG